MIVALLTAAAVTATAPVPSMRTDWWSNYYDTPTRGLAMDEISLVMAEMTVTTRGNVQSCVGKAILGNPQMGPYVCDRLKMRAEFRPARDPSGKKVAGVFRKVITVANLRPDGSETFSFKAPSFGIHLQPRPGETSDSPFEIQFYQSANGAISNCSLIEEVGINLERRRQSVEPATVEKACAEVAAQLKPAPARDRRGNPVASVQNAIVTVGSPHLNN